MLSALVSAIVSIIVTAIFNIFWQKIKKFLRYKVYKKVTAYIIKLTGKEEKLFFSYIQSIINQDRFTFIDVPLDRKKMLKIDPIKKIDEFTILNAIDNYEQCVVLGNGGFGKSVLIKKLEKIYADKYFTSEVKRYIPFRLSPKDICREGLMKALKLRCMECGVYIPLSSIEKYSTHQSLMLLIDGVEILPKYEREILSQELKGYIERSKCTPRIVLSVASERSDSVLKDMEVTKHMNSVTLHEFEDRHVDEYVRDQLVTGFKLDKLTTLIRGCGKVTKLTRIPLLLNMLLELPDWRWVECYSSWANFMESIINPMYYKHHHEEGSFVKPLHKMMALEKIAVAFCQYDKIPPTAISVIEVKSAIQDTLKESHENEIYQDKLLEELTKNSEFLVAFDDSTYYAFVNKYIQKYFAAKYFCNHEGELLVNYRKYPKFYSGVLRLWAGLSDSPINLITAVSKINPLLCLTLLSEVQSPPPKDLLDFTLESVKNEIYSIDFPDANANCKQLDKYFLRCHELGEGLGESTIGNDSGEKILEYLIDMTDSTFLSTPFIISFMALARSYSQKGAVRMAKIYNTLDKILKNLSSDEKHYRNVSGLTPPSGVGFSAVAYSYILRGRLPGYNLRDQQLAWQEANKSANKKIMYELIKSWIRTEFGTLGESGFDVLIDNLKNKSDQDKEEEYLLMLKDIGTIRALKEAKRIRDREQ